MLKPHILTQVNLSATTNHTITEYTVTSNMKNTHVKKELYPVSRAVPHFLALLYRAQHFQIGSHFPREKAINHGTPHRRPSDNSYF